MGSAQRYYLEWFILVAVWAVALPGICAKLAPDVPEAPGRPLTVAFTSRSVNLSWAPPFNADHVGVSHYIIHIRAGEDTQWEESTVVETTTNETLYQVTGLSPFTTYSFRVTAVNPSGRSEPSQGSFYIFTLREVPSGKPTITAAHNTSSTSIHMIWISPPKSSLNGEFLGYRISYRPRNDNTSDKMTEAFIKDPEIGHYTIQDLEPFTQYLVSLQVRNPEGLGPATKVVVMTDEGVPSQPLNVVFKEVTNATVAVQWEQPTTPNGVIAGYRVYYMHDNFTDVQTVRSTNRVMQYLLRRLKSFTQYKIWVKAFTWKNEGESSDPIDVLTDVAGPSAPLLRNLSCVNDKTISVQWTIPTQYDRSIDFFILQHRVQEASSVASQRPFAEVFIEASNNRPQDMEFRLTNLTTDVVHEIRVGGATRSIYRKSLVYRGHFSQVRPLLLASGCLYYYKEVAMGVDDSEPYDQYREQQVGVVIGLTATLVCIFLIALGILLWRKFFGESYYFLAESPSSLACTATTPDVASPQDVQTPVHPGVPAHLFTRHVLERHASDNLGFRRAFEHIESSTAPREAIYSCMPHNEDKNRYKNVLAYDHTRVRLDGVREEDDYVNANFIDGLHRARAYIATQGPLPSTFSAFWQMVWQENTHVVVMITNFIEAGKHKCDQYWPDKDQSAVYGDIKVTLVCQEVQESYTLRVLRMKLLNSEGEEDDDCPERDVLHFHYTAWPDHGTPTTANHILAFVQKSSQSSRDTDGPIVIHCSAGVGRTGTYIVIDAMLKQMQSIGKLDIDGYLAYIRTQRNFLIQTLEQYVFVHDVLAEAVSRRMVVQPPPEIVFTQSQNNHNHQPDQKKVKIQQIQLQQPKQHSSSSSTNNKS